MKWATKGIVDRVKWVSGDELHNLDFAKDIAFVSMMWNGMIAFPSEVNKK